MPLIEPLHVAIALGPLATYLLVLGSVNLSSRPLLTTGGRDTAALAIAVGGLVLAGPMELFLVEDAAALYGVWVWAIMLAAYALLVALVVLLLRPRLIIYNITLDQLRPLLADVAAKLDSETRWAGESVVIPQLRVQLHLDVAPLMKNVQLVSSGPEQNVPGWRQLEAQLAAVLRRSRTSPNPYGISLLGCGVLLATTIFFLLARDPNGIAQATRDLLRQ
jgi:hypothetical protein